MNYWHKRKWIPYAEKEALRKSIHGEEIGVLKPNGFEEVKLLKVEHSIFINAFVRNRKYLYRGDYTASPEENDYENSDCFLTEDGLAGFAITNDGWLISVFSTEPWRGFLRLVSPYLTKATKLVCISGSGDRRSLISTYQSLGYVEVAETIDDTALLQKYYGNDFIESFIAEYGSPRHIFMCRPSADKPINVTVFMDYFKAKEYVDKLINSKV